MMYGIIDVIKRILATINKTFCRKPLLAVYAWDYQKKDLYFGMKTIQKDFFITFVFPMNLIVVI